MRSLSSAGAPVAPVVLSSVLDADVAAAAVFASAPASAAAALASLPTSPAVALRRASAASGVAVEDAGVSSMGRGGDGFWSVGVLMGYTV